MTISIVIRAFNEGKHIGRLFFGIQQQTLQDEVEVILVDSGSTDDTLKIASRFPGQDCSKSSPRNLHSDVLSTAALNAASGEIVVMISAHCYPIYTGLAGQRTSTV